jgi:hypothetical protein
MGVNEQVTHFVPLACNYFPALPARLPDERPLAVHASSQTRAYNANLLYLLTINLRSVAFAANLAYGSGNET